MLLKYRQQIVYFVDLYSRNYLHFSLNEGASLRIICHVRKIYFRHYICVSKAGHRPALSCFKRLDQYPGSQVVTKAYQSWTSLTDEASLCSSANASRS